MLFTYTGTGGSTEEELAKIPAPGATWETWGVPPGAVVTNVQFAGGKKKLTTATLLTAASFRVELPSGGTAATGADLVPDDGDGHDRRWLLARPAGGDDTGGHCWSG